MQTWICIHGEFLRDQLCCAVCLVYAPNDQNGRRKIWDQIRNFRASIGALFLLMGDFNEVLHPRERRGAIVSTTSVRDFQDIFQDVQLMDLDIDQNFMLLRKNAASRIDRVLVEQDFLIHFLRIQAFYKNRLLSNHFPIVVVTG